jgi:prepilin-type N-terminal cleavage/methylation domain-containing protein
MLINHSRPQHTGFTIVELLIVIVVISILAAISVVAYNGIQDRAKKSKIQSEISVLAKQVEAYNATNGSYPLTGGLNVVRSDANCSGGTKQADWIPNMSIVLPQSSNFTGRDNTPGCYMYASDGSKYILSAWNAFTPNNDKSLYRRLGFRGTSYYDSNYYLCNNTSVGGMASGTYDMSNDMYKASYTISNIGSSQCDETAAGT